MLKGEKGEYQAKNIIIATGAHARPIGCKGEAEFLGRGVSYCATCDANFFEDFEVYVVGGGDAAVEEAMYLTKFARKVTIIHRRNELRAAKSIQEKAFKNEKLHFMWDHVVEEVDGDGMLSKMIVKNTKTGELTTIEADEGQSAQIRSLSGGNQQKVIIGRWLLTKPEVLLLDEPTRGIDVGAKYEIYQLILDLARDGKGVIMVSSEMPELLGICDRILVMSGGRLAGEVDAANTSQEEILTLAAKYV